MPHQGYDNGLYLVVRRGAKPVDHYGIVDIGNRLGIGNADGINPVVVHLSPSGIRVEWLRDTGAWRVLGKITDEPYAIERYEAALRNPKYDLFGHNCEHLARFIATGVHESKQLQAAALVTGLAALVIATFNQ